MASARAVWSPSGSPGIFDIKLTKFYLPPTQKEEIGSIVVRLVKKKKLGRRKVLIKESYKYRSLVLYRQGQARLLLLPRPFEFQG